MKGTLVMDKQDANATYERMGIASLLPGMTFMVELMITELDRMRQLVNPSLPIEPKDTETLPPPKKMSKYWAAMTETQRSNEVKRRLTFRKKKKPTKNQHYSTAAKSFWKGMSPEERSKEMTRRRKITAERKQKEHAAHLARSAKARQSALARWARQKLEDPIVTEIEQSIINGKESQTK